MLSLKYSRSAYNRLLYNFCQNALMHLYISLAGTTRFTPIAARNDILKKYIKPLVKDKECKDIKSDLKRILSIAKKGDIERCINTLLNELFISDEKQQTIDKAIHLLAEICEKTGLTVRVSERNDIPDENSCHLLSEHLFNRINAHGEVIQPLSLLVYSSEKERIIDVINNSTDFYPELIFSCDEDNQRHILLHPKVMQAI